MVELYWHNKYFITKVAEYKGTQEKEILDKMGFMDEKYKSLWKGKNHLISTQPTYIHLYSVSENEY